MFDWFDKTFRRREYPTWSDVQPPSDIEKVAGDMNKVLPFPELKSVPATPYVEPEKPAHTYYRLGLTDNNRVSFTMGYSELTLNKVGVQNMIEHLAVLRDQLQEEE